MTDTMAETLTVTVLETATIFEGHDTVYRYDIMATGIIEGWAVPAVVDQVKQMASVHWPDVEVIIDGDDTVTEILTKTFITKGVPSYPVETLREHPLPAVDSEGEEEVLVKRPTSGKTHRHFYGIRPLHILLTALFVGTVTGVWVLFGGNTPPPSAAVQPATAGVSAGSSTAETAAAMPAVPAVSEVPEVPTSSRTTTVLMSENFHVEVPYGYTLEEHDDAHLVTGPDPDIRIHIGVDLLHGVDEDLVRGEINRMIAADPALDAAPSGEWQGREAIDYSEDPGDGSAVNWVTWFDNGRQISVGCHTRIEPTVVHRAGCRSIVETLVLR